MTEHNETQGQAEQPKKKSLAEAAAELLAKKKQTQASGKGGPKHYENGQPVMKSQNTKKINNQRKRMGV